MEQDDVEEDLQEGCQVVYLGYNGIIPPGDFAKLTAIVAF